MYKKMLPLLMLVAGSTLSFGQDTLKASNFNPVSTDAFALKVCATGALPGSSGPNIIWDFTSLTVTSDDTGKVENCPNADPTTHCLLFPGANVILKGKGSLYQTTYYQDNSTTVSIMGYYSAPDTNIILSDPADQFRYPFTYGTSYEDPFWGVLTLGPLTGHTTGSISVNCDGWGKLLLPGRTDTNVLRVHSIETLKDSVNLLGMGTIGITDTFNTYSWYKAGYHSALLTIVTVTQSGSTSPIYNFVGYAPAQLAAVPDVPNDIISLNLYPNPVQDELNIDLNAKSDRSLRMSVFDLMGRQVAVIPVKPSAGKQHITYNTTALPKGLYMVRLQTAEGMATRKIEIQ